MTPNAPCPTNSMRTETRNIQWSSVASWVAETAVDRVAREEVTAARWEANSFKLLQLYKIEARKSSPGYRERPRDHVPVDADRVLHPHRVSARQERGRRDAARGARSEHDVVSPAQVFAAQLQSAELVLLEGVRSRDVGDEIRAVPVQYRGRMTLERGKVLRAARAGIQSDVEIARRLDRRVVLFLVHREREDTGIVAENSGRAVPLVDVQVDHGRPADQPLVLKRADRNRDVVENAKTFAVIRKRVMESAAQVDSDAAARERLPPGKDAAPRAQEGGLDELLRVGKLQDRLLEHGEPPLDELVHVGAIVHAKHLLEARASRLEDLGVGEKPSPHDFLANEAEFPGREDVPADVREITVGMDDRRRGHGTLFEGSAGRGRPAEPVLDRDRRPRACLGGARSEGAVEGHQRGHPEREKDGIDRARPDHARHLEGSRSEARW